MRHLPPLLLLLLSFLLLHASASAQCYQTFLDKGKTFLQQGKWDKAVEAFENGKGCQADKPANGDTILNGLIRDVYKKKQAAAEQKKKRVAEAQSRKQKTTRPHERGHTKKEKKSDPAGLPGMVLVRSGTFQMGSTEGKSMHSVTLSSFYLSKYEVTVKEYLQFVKETGGNAPEWQEIGNQCNITTGSNTYYKDLGNTLTADQNPIVGISWNDATEYCKWLSKKTGKTYRLPTEAEWEYAAGGGSPNATRTQWAGTSTESELQQYSNCAGIGGSSTYQYAAPVGKFQPNKLGLYDMSGNVWEWCSDWGADYPSSPQTNPTGPTEGTIRVKRGGSWGFLTVGCLVVFRSYDLPTSRSKDTGFRVAASFQ